MGRFKPSFHSSFDRQYKKLKPKQQDLADTGIRLLFEYVDTNDPERRLEIGRALRIKPIEKFKKQKPKRYVATFDADGRIVWYLDNGKLTLNYLYIGNHSVLNKD